jgi:predicted nuclease of predicted toxin-antitoxin system
VKFKIDENLPSQVSDLLRRAGFESDTVAEEGLAGADDEMIGVLVRTERRVLVTLDTDIGNIQAYPPDQYQGIIVLRPAFQDKLAVLSLITRLIQVLREHGPDRELWIVEPDRVRMRRSEPPIDDF